MPVLRILVLDGVSVEGWACIEAVQLAMLSWRNGEWSVMPLSLHGIPETAVLDLQDCGNMETLPDNLQARAGCDIDTCYCVGQGAVCLLPACCVTAVWPITAVLWGVLLPMCYYCLPAFVVCCHQLDKIEMNPTGSQVA